MPAGRFRKRYVIEVGPARRQKEDDKGSGKK